MSFAIRATGGRVILIHVAKQNGYESCLLFSPKERSAKSVSKENVRGMQDDTISRKQAIDAVRTCYDTETITMDNGDEYIHYGDAVGEIEQLPPAQPEPCEYCNEDSDGYVKPIEKNNHAFVRFGMNGWELSLRANGWHGSTKIMYCPMCGRELKHG